ncbi:MAG: hypothetical protein JXR71_08850 [Bacteroidales bacterium]|nr:hypothetical protein [Bacteroidales bacterium]
MNHKSFLFFILLPFLFAGCTKEEYTANNGVSQSEILGTWKGQDNCTKYSFFENNEFTDSTFYGVDNTLVQVIKGTYEVKDSFLFFTDVRLLYDRNKFNDKINASYTYVFPQMRLQLADSLLTLTNVAVYNRLSENRTGGVYGTWSSLRFICSFDRDQVPDLMTGTLTTKLEFISNPDLYRYKQSYVVGQQQWEDTSGFITFQYKPAEKKIELAGTDFPVSFSTNQMLIENGRAHFKKVN